MMMRILESRSGLLLAEGIRQGLDRLRKNHVAERKTLPQRLKPDSFCGVCGTTQVVPFQKNRVFPPSPARLKSCPVTKLIHLRICKALLMTRVKSCLVTKLILLITFAAVPALAQGAPAASTGAYQIGGTVMNTVTGEPLRQAAVAGLWGLDQWLSGAISSCS